MNTKLKINKNCFNCDNIFSIIPSRASRAKYCSRQCKATKEKGDNNLICVCGVSFRRNKTKLLLNNYCSRSCKAKEQARITGQRPPSRLGIPVSLEQRLKISAKLKGKSKNPETVKRSAETNKARGHKRSVEFCENRRKVMTGKYVGENSPSWKGGITPYYRVMRVARLKAVGGSHTTAEWETLQAQYNWTCPCCKKSEVKLTKDHIIPVIKGGSDNIENIQPLCGSCNSKKHIKVIKYDYNIINLNE